MPSSNVLHFAITFFTGVCIQDAKLLPYHKISKNNCKESIVFNFKIKYQGYKLPCLQRDALTGMLPDGEKHPCFRKCDDKPMICYYNFHVEWYQSMSKACFDCPLNPSDCNRADCVMADGVSRTVTVVNRKMPGPSIEVSCNLLKIAFLSLFVVRPQQLSFCLI